MRWQIFMIYKIRIPCLLSFFKVILVDESIEGKLNPLILSNKYYVPMFIVYNDEIESVVGQLFYK